MAEYTKFVKFYHKIVILGFGSVGQGVLPLLLRHIDIAPDQIKIISADEGGREEADYYHVPFTVVPITKNNYREILANNLSQGDFLLNVSINVASTELIEFCHYLGVGYLDACIEPWAGGYVDVSVPLSERSNYKLREEAMSLRQKLGQGPTAVLSHGANPGLVSHWAKQALINIAHDLGVMTDLPNTRQQWAQLAQTLNIKTVQCAERDTQVSSRPKQRNEFVNTWSVEGFAGEGCQPSELGWGTHEQYFPIDGNHHGYGCGAAIYLNRSGITTRVRGWTPLEGSYHGFLITHNESISIADYLTVKENGAVRYRPTVYYAYHPCDDAVLSIHELNGRNFQLQSNRRLMMDDVSDGVDELGVLLMGHNKGAYWYGSVLSIQEARTLAPYNNATSLQVVAGVLAGLIWAIENPQAGIVEPDDMPFDQILKIANPYLGCVVGQYSDWTPLKDRGVLFAEDVDTADPWQFKNFRVI